MEEEVKKNLDMVSGDLSASLRVKPRH